MANPAEFYKYISENTIDMEEVIRINNERLAREKKEEEERVAAKLEEERIAAVKFEEERIAAAKLEEERIARVAKLEEERARAIEQERQRVDQEEEKNLVDDFYRDLNSANITNISLSPLPPDEFEHIFTQPIGDVVTTEVVDGSMVEDGLFDFSSFSIPQQQQSTIEDTTPMHLLLVIAAVREKTLTF